MNQYGGHFELLNLEIENYITLLQLGIHFKFNIKNIEINDKNGGGDLPNSNQDKR